MLKIMRVAGSSMSPTLNTDDYIVAVRQPTWWPKKRDQIYVFDHPSMGWMVKRFQKTTLGSFITFRGDNPLSISEEAIGPIDNQLPLYRMVMRISADST
ncbi:S24/S26 family peptidase [Grimontia sp. NTOU-MAR1]|uniref:S24/S26 family peptidase n=1 Tax=Grimontia sp. NTOU-MAR1 TaxID=3111011 RepID=UPI002DBCAFC9|nr:S24/S26 family peptidase [Grimontia sp. NTOU-MAR1]WRV97933.1 S24/S26 family peptidase [Grimontia sp. NTOU-MAR1]